MVSISLLRLARAIRARECLDWAAIQLWAARQPGAYRVDVSLRRWAGRTTEVSVTCIARDGTALAQRRWYAQRLGADLAARLYGGTRLLIDRPGDDG